RRPAPGHRAAGGRWGRSRPARRGDDPSPASVRRPARLGRAGARRVRCPSVSERGWPGYYTFERHEWARLREATPLTLSDEDLEALRGLNDRIDLDEVTEVYLPLSRLLN